jgi:hypothetical protein
VELPLTMLAGYFRIIAETVNQNLRNSSYINSKDYPFKSMEDVQKILNRTTPLEEISDHSNRKTILLSARLFSLAIKEFKNDQVILLVANIVDEKQIANKKIPPNFKIYKLNAELKRINISNEEIKTLQQTTKDLINEYKTHEIFGSNKFFVWLQKQLISSIKLIKCLNLLLENNPIKVILYQTEYTAHGKTLALLGQKYGLPFINVQYEGLMTDVSIIPTHASYCCVWGEDCKKWLESKGVDSRKIKIVGSLRFEENMPFINSLEENEFRSLLNIPENNYIVTFTAQTFSIEINKEILDWINSAIQSLPVTVILKEHPGHKNLLAGLVGSNIIVLPETITLYNLLNNTDFLMTISSTTAVEAAMFNKGILVLQPKEITEGYHYNRNYNGAHKQLANASAGYVIHNKEELYNTLKNLVESNNYRENLISLGREFLGNTIQTQILPSKLIGELVRSLI